MPVSVIYPVGRSPALSLTYPISCIHFLTDTLSVNFRKKNPSGHPAKEQQMEEWKISSRSAFSNPYSCTVKSRFNRLRTRSIGCTWPACIGLLNCFVTHHFHTCKFTLTCLLFVVDSCVSAAPPLLGLFRSLLHPAVQW